MSEMKGAFVASLKRNNRQIRDDRAEAIVEDAQILYQRTVQDLDLKIKRKKREREQMLDLSPTNAQSLMLASDFDSKQYVEKDIDLAVEIRNLEIKLDLAQTRYEYLFEGGPEPKTASAAVIEETTV